ncbi:response regulator [Diaphorobacter sp. HDW4A]|uniref:response regulator n=1 Tax=Diaphorobacter sp. HDW4A TaxID=2714924 RepID=UPI001409D543|nr:response regulator [Diaphorobacter sp. HDW4A]QIL81701.1 response regulator [Diaphorobacter sp. HDW4A]
MRVLYVEDNDQLRESITLLLQGDDREVSPCASAEEALELDALKPFDLVITDVSLPGISGLELSARLLGADVTRWIVLCSGYQLDEHIRDLGGPNIRALVKPFGIDELESTVKSVQDALSSPH